MRAVCAPSAACGRENTSAVSCAAWGVCPHGEGHVPEADGAQKRGVVPNTLCTQNKRERSKQRRRAREKVPQGSAKTKRGRGSTGQLQRASLLAEVRDLRMHVRAALHQQPHAALAAVQRRQLQGRVARAVGAQHVGARAQQQLQRLGVAVQRRVVQRRTRCSSSTVDIRPLQQQRPHGNAVAARRGLAPVSSKRCVVMQGARPPPPPTRRKAHGAAGMPPSPTQTTCYCATTTPGIPATHSCLPRAARCSAAAAAAAAEAAAVLFTVLSLLAVA